MERASAAEWAKRVERWKDSGLTAKEFAAQCGFKASMLSYWQWKIRAGQGGSGSGGIRKRARQGESDSRSVTGTKKASCADAVSMQVVELSSPVVTGSSPALELVLAGGARVRVPVDFDEATLTRVLRAVEASR